MERLMVSFFIVFATCTFSCFSSDEEKQVGAEGESCFDNGTCNPSLTCVSDRWDWSNLLHTFLPYCVMNQQRSAEG